MGRSLDQVMAELLPARRAKIKARVGKIIADTTLQQTPESGHPQPTKRKS